MPFLYGSTLGNGSQNWVASCSASLIACFRTWNCTPMGSVILNTIYKLRAAFFFFLSKHVHFVVVIV